MDLAKQSRIQALAGLIGEPIETDCSRLIWTGLVNFCNRPADDKPLPMHVAGALRATIALCVHGAQESELRGSVYELECFEDVDRLSADRKMSPDEAFSKLALGFQRQLHELLDWIADPNRVDRDHRRKSLGFLVEYGEEVLARYDYEANHEFDDTGNVGYPLFYWKHPRSFESIMTPLARFIFERLERYHEGALTLDEASPIVRCRREECGRLSIAQRKTKDFCSDSCRTLNRQKEKPEEHAAYMREYRKNNYTKPFPSVRDGKKTPSRTQST